MTVINEYSMITLWLLYDYNQWVIYDYNQWLLYDYNEVHMALSAYMWQHLQMGHGQITTDDVAAQFMAWPPRVCYVANKHIHSTREWLRIFIRGIMRLEWFLHM